MRTRKWQAMVLALAAILYPAGSLFAAPRYSYHDLGTLGGSESATHLSDKGHVAGYSGSGDDRRAWRGTKSAGMQDLGRLPGHARSSVNGVNAKGWVVGTSETADESVFRAWLWTPAGGLVDLACLEGHDVNEAYAINAKGQVVGVSYNSSTWAERAWLWSKSTLQDLGVLPGYERSSARAINKKGQIAGNAYPGAGGPHAWLWTKGVLQDLPPLPGYDASHVSAINARGQVVGYSRTLDYSAVRACLWDAAGAVQDLGTLGGDETETEAINSKGLVVGRSHDDQANSRAFLWTAAEGMMDLNSLVVDLPPGVVLQHAYDINKKGWIVGTAAGGRAFLLTP